jgi:2-polyprenyl-3-methyl-5-hydroxy-6-metoxy-1,4-benzoquinol methylase
VTEDILNRYDGEYFSYERENEESFLNLMKLGLRDIGFEEITSGLGESPRFLDIGCATGRLSAWLRQKGWLSEGVEVCRAAAEFGSLNFNVPIFPGTLDDAGFEDSRFHCVHNSHVIEHINRPDLFVKEIFRILKPGGFFVCTTPNCAGLRREVFLSVRLRTVLDYKLCYSANSGVLLFRITFSFSHGKLLSDWLKAQAFPA